MIGIALAALAGYGIAVGFLYSVVRLQRSLEKDAQRAASSAPAQRHAA